MSAYISERRPADVARAVERHVAQGITSFVLKAVDAGGMLDRERMGAARYSAGPHAGVELEGVRVPAASR